MKLMFAQITLNKKNSKTFFNLFNKWGLVRQDIVKIAKTKKQEQIISMYLIEEKIQLLQTKGVNVKILLDLSKIPDPKTYVSKGNRYKKRLDALKGKKGVR